LSTKRIKITFGSINAGKITHIEKSDIAESKKRIKDEMESVVRDFEKKETRSKQDAEGLILNS